MNQKTLAAIGIGAAVALVWLLPGHQFDFSFDWITARALLEGINPHLTLGEIADQLGLSTRLQYAHPRLPGALILQAPFGLLPFSWFHIAGRLLTVASAVWLGWMVSKWTGWPVGRVLLAVPLILLVWPFSAVLAASQYAVFLVTGLIGMTMFAKSDHWRAGLPLGVAVVYKLWPWLVIPALWLSGRRRAAYGAVLAFSVLNLVGLALPHVTVEGTLAAVLHVQGMTGPTNLSPVQFFPVWVGPLVGLVVVALMRWRIVVAVPVALATSPVLWGSYLPALMLPAIWLYVGGGVKVGGPVHPEEVSPRSV